MTLFTVKTLPRGAAPDRPLEVTDLTQEVFVTNSEKAAKSAVDGSLRPMAIFVEGVPMLSTFIRTPTHPIFRRGNPETAAKKGFTVPKGPARPGRANFSKEEPPKRELIVERV